MIIILKILFGFRAFQDDSFRALPPFAAFYLMAFKLLRSATMVSTLPLAFGAVISKDSADAP